MNKNKLVTKLSQYKATFSQNWKKENYKWIAVKHFQNNWDTDAADFPTMLENSLQKVDNLLHSHQFFPGDMIVRFAELNPEKVRQMFKLLFDESKDLSKRISAFIDSSNVLLAKYQKKHKDAQNHYQTENAISTYLWLRYPDKYYIYKYTVYKRVIELLEAPYVAKKGGAIDNLISCFSLYDEIQKIMKKDKDLINLLRSHLTKAHYKDTSLRTLVDDFCFFISQETKQTDTNNKAETTQSCNYWWLNANPKIWKFSNIAIGEEEYYTVYNEKSGRPRRIHQNFMNAKPGDIVIGYQATPVKKITALCQITKSQDGKNLYFKKTQDINNPITYQTLKNTPELANMEFFKNLNGSLFKLTQEEYNTIIGLIRQKNEELTPLNTSDSMYDKFLKVVYNMTPKKYNEIVELLENKKNIILQGSPGVGKSFAAPLIAYAILGRKDDSHIQKIQFHQNYSYEDFVMGYKPTANGFVLKHGIFYEFCTKAREHPDQKYFLIIDEINRGNLSKIFGELLTLIESDYRDKEPVNMAYTGEPFSIPKNLYIIGMMNTADRSLALIDYALRRRFSFVDMEPAFESDGFKEYLKDNPKFKKLADKLIELNQEIAQDSSLGDGFRIGHSYLCNKEANVASIIQYDLIPIIKEYWFDDESKRKKHINAFEELLK